MLRSRSRRAVSSKQGLMAAEPKAQTCVPSSPARSPKKPISSFLGSPRIFNGFLGRTLSGSEYISVGGMSISPTSILDGKQILNVGNDQSPIQPDPVCTEKILLPESLGVGLALIDSSQSDEKNRGSVLFGSKLKVQIPSLITPAESPADFGIKTPRNPPLISFSVQPKESPLENLSLSEMELSEDYTCVITHGPNPKTTHIFDNCVVQSCCGVMKLSELQKGNNGFSSSPLCAKESQSFLKLCYCCNMNLEDGKDIYMYRGDRAFCSHECRSEEMVMDLDLEGKKNEEMERDDAL